MRTQCHAYPWPRKTPTRSSRKKRSSIRLSSPHCPSRLSNWVPPLSMIRSLPGPGAPLDTLRLAFDATQRDVPAVQGSTARVIDRRRMPPMGSPGGCTCRPSSRRSSDAARTAPWHVSDESDCAQPCVVAVPGYRYRRAGPILLTLPTGPAGAREGSAFSMGASSSSLATAPYGLRRAQRSVVFPPR